METLTLSPQALEQLGRMLRDRPWIQFPVLFLEVAGQKPELLEDDSNNPMENSQYAHTHAPAE